MATRKKPAAAAAPGRQQKKAASPWLGRRQAGGTGKKAPSESVPCLCTAYPYPHRHGTGKCKGGK